jgi:hypothetical protein
MTIATSVDQHVVWFNGFVVLAADHFFADCPAQKVARPAYGDCYVGDVSPNAISAARNGCPTMRRATIAACTQSAVLTSNGLSWFCLSCRGFPG